MRLIRIVESDNFFVDYDKGTGMYRVSVNKQDRDITECWFDAFHEEVVNWESFASGAVALMNYFHDYYKGAEPIWPSEMEWILEEFLKERCRGEINDEQN